MNDPQTSPAQQPDYDFERPHVPTQTSRYVFFAGNLLPASIRNANESWRRGGIIRSEYDTLKHCGGYIGQCEITPMRPYMQAQLESLVHPNKLGSMQQTAVLNVNGQRVTIGIYEDPEEGVQKWDGLLRSIVYPDAEVLRLTGQNDGIVSVPVRSDAEADLAQYFLFPNWDRVRTGLDELPERLQDLENYFKGRQRAAENEFEAAVADAALRSCASLRVYASQSIERANKEFESHKTKGHPYSYGKTALLCFQMLDVPRLDIVNQQQSENMNRFAEALALLAERQAPAPAPAVPQVPDTLLQIADVLKEFSPEDLLAMKDLLNKRAENAATDPDETPAIDGVKVGDTVRFNGQEGKVAKLLAGALKGRVSVVFVDENGEERSQAVKVEELTKV